MKILLLILLPFCCLGQTEAEITFSELPDTIKYNLTAEFKNAYHLSEGGYLVETGTKKWSTDTLYNEAGGIIEISKKYRSGVTAFGIISMAGVIIILSLLLGGVNIIP